MQKKGQNCSNCKYSKEQRIDPVSIQTTLICEHSPPDTVVVPQQSGLAFMPAKRIVSDQVWCWQYQEKTPDIALAN